MITGFNTDIEHNGVIYHVQTEDKGLETPLILSLVYNRGTILASKRSPYNDLVQNGFDEKILAERLQKQHKLICAAVRAGRIEELKKMTAKESASKKGLKTNLSEPAPIAVAENGNFAKVSSVKDSNSSILPIIQEKFSAPIPQPTEELVWDLPLQILEDDLIVEPDSILEEETVLGGEAVEIITGFSEPEDNGKAELEIRFLTETEFKAGERKTLNISIFRGNPNNFIVAAQVMVKVLGSSFRPLIFHAKTDEKGVAVVHLQVPQFRSGRGAVLIRAVSDGEEAELRQIIRQN